MLQSAVTLNRISRPPITSTGDLECFMSGPEAAKPNAGWPDLLRLSLRHLIDNYAARVRLADLARLTGRTPFQIIRAFRKELGITPHALLIRIRVERATALLAKGESIAGVATEVGFVDQAHFTRHFKRMHATTPRRYLNSRKIWGAPQLANG